MLSVGKNMMFLALMFVASVTHVCGSLNVDPYAVEREVKSTRDLIYVDVKFVRPQPYNTLSVLPSGEIAGREIEHHDFQVCSSVDGPRCYMDEQLSVIPRSVMPDEEIFDPEKDETDLDDESDLLREFWEMDEDDGEQDGDIKERLHKVDMTEINQLASLVGAQHLPGDVDYDSFRQGLLGREGQSRTSKLAGGGRLSRIPRGRAKRGLPKGVSVAWEGKWVVSEGTVGQRGAQLTGTTGYMRFTKPVIVRSLAVQLGKYVSLIGGRLKGETLWMRALRNNYSNELDPVIMDIAQDSRQNVGLQAVDEIFFLTATGLKLLSIEVFEASGQQISVLLLGNEEHADLVYANVDMAATEHLLSLNDVIKRNLRLKSRKESISLSGHKPDEVNDEDILKQVTKMVSQPQMSGDIIKQIFESGSVPSQLLKEIESHDLIGNLHNVLADTRAAKLDDEGLQQVNTYNDLLMAAWLHWAQGIKEPHPIIEPRWKAANETVAAEVTKKNSDSKKTPDSGSGLMTSESKGAEL